MVLLNALLTPDYGLIFWTALIFLILWYFLGRFAWKPIAEALQSRETKITDSLNEAQKAREEMANLKADNERLLNEAKEERARIIKEAKEIGDNIVNQAKDKAKSEIAEIKEAAQLDIQNQKMAAITEVKNLIGTYAIQLSEQVLGRELKDRKEQETYVLEQVSKMKF